MGMQSASVQNPYSSAQQGKGQGLPNPEAQMSPNQPPMDAQQEMMRRFPQQPVQQMDVPMGAPNVEPPIGASGFDGMANKMQNMQGQGMQGKGQGAQGAITFPGQGGQPAMGQPNAYPNTINPSDNTGMSQPMSTGGKSKGAR
jgi:hypothetical protein